jgi:hypothetical protein
MVVLSLGQATGADREATHQKIKSLAANPGSLSEQDIRFLEKNYSFHESIQALSKSKEPAARAALFRLATGTGVQTNWATGAAKAIAYTMTDKLEALPLLRTDNAAIFEHVLPEMIGCTLTAEAWAEIKPLLERPSARVRGLVAMIVKEDKGSVPGREKAAALIAAMKGIDELPGAQKKLRLAFQPLYFTEAELAFYDLFLALSSMQWVDFESLKSLTPEDAGNPRDCVMLARTARGDPGAKEEARKIATSHPSAMFRWLALQAFERGGTVEDLPTLEQVAREDPLFINDCYAEDVQAYGRDCYLLRERAQRALWMVKGRAAVTREPK